MRYSIETGGEALHNPRSAMITIKIENKSYKLHKKIPYCYPAGSHGLKAELKGEYWIVRQFRAKVFWLVDCQENGIQRFIRASTKPERLEVV